MSAEKKLELSRRDFITIAAAAAGGSLLAGCRAQATPAATEVAGATEVVGAAATATPMTTILGRPLPADAAPWDEQVLRIPTTDAHALDNAAEGYSVIWDVDSNFDEHLVVYDNDWNVVDQECESHEMSEDGLVYTYHLRPNLTWDDGTPVTADDWVNHIRIWVNPEVANAAAFQWFSIKNAEEVNYGKLPLEELGVRAVDPLTFEITLKERTPWWNHFMSTWAGNGTCKAMWDKYGMTMYTSVESTRLSGAWKLTEWSKDQRIVLEARDNYKGACPGYLKRVHLA
jgi:ABC-type transport system substrate-binding protein